LQLKKLNAQLSELTDAQARYISVAKDGPYKPGSLPLLMLAGDFSMRLLLVWILNAIALLAVAYLFPWCTDPGLEGGGSGRAGAGLVNALIKTDPRDSDATGHDPDARPVPAGHQRVAVWAGCDAVAWLQCRVVFGSGICRCAFVQRHLLAAVDAHSGPEVGTGLGKHQLRVLSAAHPKEPPNFAKLRAQLARLKPEYFSVTFGAAVQLARAR
jgi:hypothetical protein